MFGVQLNIKNDLIPTAVAPPIAPSTKSSGMKCMPPSTQAAHPANAGCKTAVEPL